MWGPQRFGVCTGCAPPVNICPSTAKLPRSPTHSTLQKLFSAGGKASAAKEEDRRHPSAPRGPRRARVGAGAIARVLLHEVGAPAALRRATCAQTLPAKRCRLSHKLLPPPAPPQRCVGDGATWAPSLTPPTPPPPSPRPSPPSRSASVFTPSGGGLRHPSTNIRPKGALPRSHTQHFKNFFQRR